MNMPGKKNITNENKIPVLHNPNSKPKAYQENGLSMTKTKIRVAKIFKTVITAALDVTLFLTNSLALSSEESRDINTPKR